jgi:hypothetical protein
MKYGCTPIGVTQLGDHVFDRELSDMEKTQESIEWFRRQGIDDSDLLTPEDDDHSDEQFDRMDRQNELR